MASSSPKILTPEMEELAGQIRHMLEDIHLDQQRLRDKAAAVGEAVLRLDAMPDRPASRTMAAAVGVAQSRYLDLIRMARMRRRNAAVPEAQRIALRWKGRDPAELERRRANSPAST